MITLHDVYEQGNDTVKASVLAFGALHPVGVLLPARARYPDAELDWKLAERHFTRVIETIMGAVSPSSSSSREGTVRRAENAAIGFLLASNTRPSRCPICVKWQRPPL